MARRRWPLAGGEAPDIPQTTRRATALRLRFPLSVRWLGLALVALLAGTSCATITELSTRHRESGVNSEFTYGALPFSEYLSLTRSVIARTRVDLQNSRADTVIEANSPFELVPDASCPAGKPHRYARGVLLIHGLTDSPFMTRDVGRFFNSRCFLVRAILLTGHGTVPGDLLSVDHSAWVKETRWAVEGLNTEVDALYLAGFSTGGALSLQAALTGPPVRGLFLFSPALKIKSRMAFLARVVGFVKAWLEVAPDEDYAKYESFTTNAADQIYRLTQELETLRSATKLTPPMFVALSADDATSDSAETLAYFRSQSNPASVLILYANGQPAVGDARIRVAPAARPEEGILEHSHISIAVAPENAHYGRLGDYRNCKHYLDDPKAWSACKTANPIARGERGTDKPKGTIFARLTYNPDFEHLTQELDQFLGRVGGP